MPSALSAFQNTCFGFHSFLLHCTQTSTDLHKKDFLKEATMNYVMKKNNIMDPTQNNFFS